MVDNVGGTRSCPISIYLTADKYVLFEAADNPLFAKYATYKQSSDWFTLSVSLIPDSLQKVIYFFMPALYVLFVAVAKPASK